MNEELIALVAPFFFVLIALELRAARRAARASPASPAASAPASPASPDRWYRFHDSIACLSLGVLQQLVAPFARVVVLGGYIWVFHRFALARLPAASPLTWALALLGVDLAYYGFHRA